MIFEVPSNPNHSMIKIFCFFVFTSGWSVSILFSCRDSFSLLQRPSEITVTHLFRSILSGLSKYQGEKKAEVDSLELGAIF